MMAIGISPTVDFAFKKLFGSPEHTAVTIHFLNAILGGKPRIISIKFLNPSLGKDTEDDKLPILDILAIDEHGRLLNIEMQTTLPLGIRQRLTYYVACLYAGQLTKGADYFALCPAISICVLTKSMFPEKPELHLDFRLRDAAGQVLTDDLQIHTLELPKLRVTAENVKQASPIEQWGFFLQNVETLTPADVGQMFPDREFSEAAGVLEMIARTPEEALMYQARLKAQRDEVWKANWALRAEETGRAAGLEKGLEEGMAEGKRVGLQEGKREGLQEGKREGLEEGLREGEEKGRQEGEAKGLRKGALLGRIALLQELLGVAAPDSAELLSYNETQLSKVEEELKGQLSGRGQ